MKNFLLLITSLAVVPLSWAVPSEINYQGRLTDANGDAVTGDVAMSLKMFDAATAGNEIYSEDIGPVILDSNGAYSFQFGANGQSIIQVTEIIASTDGVAVQFSKNLEETPLNNLLTLTDGNITWSSSEGSFGAIATATTQIFNGFLVEVNLTNNGEGYIEPPVVTIEGDGVGASAEAVVEDGIVTSIIVNTAGSGYTSASVTIAAPPLPYIVSYENNSVVITYDVPPPEQTLIVATYQSSFDSIVSALSAVSTHWLELAVDGIAQSPRQKILSVPFAKYATNATTKEFTTRILGPWFTPDYRSGNYSYPPSHSTVYHYITPNPSYKKIIGMSYNSDAGSSYILYRNRVASLSSGEEICRIGSTTPSTIGNPDLPVILDWENYDYFLKARGDGASQDFKITYEYSE